MGEGEGKCEGGKKGKNEGKSKLNPLNTGLSKSYI